jgi:hypothetical protein
MSDITKKFYDFKEDKTKKFDKDKEFQPLSDDIIALSKLDNGDYKKVKGPVEIVQITGVITDEDEIKKLDEIAGGPVISTDLGVKQVKRGDIIWITAFIQKPGTQSWSNQQSQATLKCRIVDIYMGLNKLNSLK